ncbi:hypothetical protein ACFFX0_15205 [Citricoccus parietis]|uniref:Uncharacterized protein n=1 Tax=Citricoccus parietis TaxID=592307 RepID=A0ABV5G1E8_9MICC
MSSMPPAVGVSVVFRPPSALPPFSVEALPTVAPARTSGYQASWTSRGWKRRASRKP